MKAAREFKNYITKYREHLKRCYWDDLMIIIKMQTCKKNRKRDKRIRKDEWE